MTAKQQSRLHPLRVLILKNGKTNRWLSQQTGIGENEISLMTNKGMRPSDDQAAEIAKAFGITTEQLAEEMGR